MEGFDEDLKKPLWALNYVKCDFFSKWDCIPLTYTMYLHLLFKAFVIETVASTSIQSYWIRVYMVQWTSTKSLHWVAGTRYRHDADAVI